MRSIISMLVAVVFTFAFAGDASSYPLGGTDQFTAIADVVMDFTGLGGGAGQASGVLRGSATITRKDPVNDAGFDTIDTEIVSMSLTGDLGGTATDLTLNPLRPSLGQIQQITEGQDFPADTFFNVFFLLDLDIMPSGNPHFNFFPLRLFAMIDDNIPPLRETYSYPGASALSLESPNGSLISLLDANLTLILIPTPSSLVLLSLSGMALIQRSSRGRRPAQRLIQLETHQAARQLS